jgi:hypothetical protein
MRPVFRILDSVIIYFCGTILFLSTTYICFIKGGIKASKRHHTEDKMVTKKRHLMEIYVEMQKHFQQLNSDLLSTTKENGMFSKEIFLIHKIVIMF